MLQIAFLVILVQNIKKYVKWWILVVKNRKSNKKDKKLLTYKKNGDKIEVHTEPKTMFNASKKFFEKF